MLRRAMSEEEDGRNRKRNDQIGDDKKQDIGVNVIYQKKSADPRED